MLISTATLDDCPHAPIPRVADRTALKQACDTIDSSGGTDIGAALDEGFGWIYLYLDAAAILLLHGDGGYTNQVEQYKTAGHPIYTIGLGTAPNTALLSMLATETGEDDP